MDDASLSNAHTYRPSHRSRQALHSTMYHEQEHAQLSLMLPRRGKQSACPFYIPLLISDWHPLLLRKPIDFYPSLASVPDICQAPSLHLTHTPHTHTHTGSSIASQWPSLQSFSSQSRPSLPAPTRSSLPPHAHTHTHTSTHKYKPCLPHQHAASSSSISIVRCPWT